MDSSLLLNCLLEQSTFLLDVGSHSVQEVYILGNDIHMLEEDLVEFVGKTATIVLVNVLVLLQLEKHTMAEGYNSLLVSPYEKVVPRGYVNYQQG